MKRRSYQTAHLQSKFNSRRRVVENSSSKMSTPVTPLPTLSLAPRMLKGRNMEVTTPTPTPSPPPIDPHEYEKATFENQLDDRSYDTLKEHIRLVRGLQLTAPASMPISRSSNPCSCQKPKVAPRENETSRIRARLRKHRLLQRSGKLASGKELTPKEEKALFDEVKHLNAEQLEEQCYHDEIRYLKYMAEHVQSSEFRVNRASEFRYKHNRGEPLLTGALRYNFETFEKPPFVMARDYKPPPRWKMPPIDKKREVWLLPTNDVDGVPLHFQMKSPQTKPAVGRKANRKPIKRQYKRSLIRPSQPTKRPPWNYYIPAGYMDESAEESATRVDLVR